MTVSEFLDSATNTFSSTIVVNQTTYNIENHWLKLAANYFNIDLTRTVTDSSIYNDVENEISLLKTGLFGYFNSIASSEIKNAVYYKNMVMDEHFLNTASFPESIYNHAKLYNVPVSLATPSHILAAMTIRRDDLINSPLKKEIISEQNVNIRALKTYEIVLDRNYNFVVGKYRFRLPYPIQIVLKQESIKDDDYSITARYVTDSKISSYLSLTNSPQVKVYQDMAGSIRYVHFQIDLYQVDITENRFTVSSEDITDTLFYPVSYTDQLANISAKYIYNGVEYPLSLYFNNTFTPTDPDEKFGYYTYVDDDTLQISFSSIGDSFRPKYNSEIVVEVETTKGSEGNFNFNDSITFNYTGDSVDNYSSMITQVVPVNGTSSGGANKLSIWEEKQKIISAILGRDNLILDTDLANFFKNINSQNAFNGSSIEFLKKRDDVLKRVWSAFLSLRDKNGKILPTNTAPYIDVSRDFFKNNKTYFGSQGFVIPEHTLVYYNPNQQNSNNEADGKFIIAENGLDTVISGTKPKTKEAQSVTLRDLLDRNNANYDRNALVYTTPYLTKIDTDPLVQANYYMLDIDQDITLNYKYLNDLISDTFNITHAHIDRKFSAEDLSNKENTFNADTWNITFDLNTSEAYTQNKNNIVVRGILVDSKTNAKYGYFNFVREDPDNNPTFYTAHLSTDRSFGSNGNDGSLLNLTNSLIDSSGTPINEVPINENLILRIGVLYKDSTLRNNMDNDDVQIFLQDEFPNNSKNPDGTDAKISDYALAMTSETVGDFNLYKNLSSITTSFTSLVHDSTDPWNENGNSNDVASKEFTGLEYVQNLLKENAKTWVAINDEIQQVDDNGEAIFTSPDSSTKFTIKVIGSNVYRYSSDKNHLYQMINSKSSNLNFDATQGEFIKDNVNIRLDGLIAIIPDGVYISRYDKSFRSINGNTYEVLDNKFGVIFEVKDDKLHYPLNHQGVPSDIASDQLKTDSNVKTIVAFYDAMYTVTSDDGKFLDNSGNQYQITASGLYIIQNAQRYKVESAFYINRSRNYTDAEADVGRPNGLFLVLHNTIALVDSLGVTKNVIYPQNKQTRKGLTGTSTYVDSSVTSEIDPQDNQDPITNPTPVNTGEFIRVIPSGNYQGIYIIFPQKDMRGKLEDILDSSTGNNLKEPISSLADIYRVDMLGLADMSKNYNTDSNFPGLYNIWTNQAASAIKPNHNVVLLKGNDDYIDMWNKVNNTENADGYNLASAVGDGVFSRYLPNVQKDFRVEMFPLIGAQYFRYNYGYIYELLNGYIDVMQQIILRLENNTSIDMKFTNTFGISKNWYVSDRGTSANSDGTVLRYITRTDFLFDFTIHLYSNIESNIDKKIKQYISDFVEASADQNVIAISNLTSLLENNFDIIHYIEYNGLSGRVIDPTYINQKHDRSDYNNLPFVEQYNPIEKEGKEDIIDSRWQRITNANVDFLDMSLEEIRYHVPELINIKKELHDNVIALDTNFLNYHNYKISDDGQSIISTNAAGSGSSTTTVDGDKGVKRVVTGQLYDYVMNISYLVD